MTCPIISRYSVYYFFFTSYGWTPDSDTDGTLLSKFPVWRWREVMSVSMPCSRSHIFPSVVNDFDSCLETVKYNFFINWRRQCILLILIASVISMRVPSRSSHVFFCSSRSTTWLIDSLLYKNNHVTRHHDKFTRSRPRNSIWSLWKYELFTRRNYFHVLSLESMKSLQYISDQKILNFHLRNNQKFNELTTRYYNLYYYVQLFEKIVLINSCQIFGLLHSPEVSDEVRFLHRHSDYFDSRSNPRMILRFEIDTLNCAYDFHNIDEIILKTVAVGTS